MKRLLHVDRAVLDILRQAAPTLRAAIADTLLDLIEDPEPLRAVPYGGIPDAFELRTEIFRVVYTHGPDHISVWVLEINT
ncbi:type II toxin-antitoxin system RelE/ParE family toxin [Nonomuraea sp. NPDC047897]|uniref:type II toxin-antitoxin system RelE/ParE family toxin n=1 Tax=Nonomuraea sp. NPDC047897 TaxID=3364346 RepID=UPI0037124359